MHRMPLRVRRLRRTDFVAVCELYRAAGLTVPVADRATLHRFRKVVADPGSDVYAALDGERVIGLVHLSYNRRLAAGPLARVEALVVDPSVREPECRHLLSQFARLRARRRFCTEIQPDPGAYDREQVPQD